MKIYNSLLTILIIGVAGFFYTRTFDFPSGLGNGVPGPSFYPRIVLGLVILCSLLHLVNVMREKNQPLFSKEERSKIIQLLCVLGSTFIFVFLFGKVHFLILSMIVLFVLGIIFKLSWRSAVLTAVTLSVFVYFVFTKAFHVTL